MVENEYEGELPLHLQGLDPQVFANLVLNKIHITRPVTKNFMWIQMWRQFHDLCMSRFCKTKSEIDQKKETRKKLYLNIPKWKAKLKENVYFYTQKTSSKNYQVKSKVKCFFLYTSHVRPILEMIKVTLILPRGKTICVLLDQDLILCW